MQRAAGIVDVTMKRYCCCCRWFFSRFFFFFDFTCHHVRSLVENAKRIEFEDLKRGMTVVGRVSRVESFGLFVKLDHSNNLVALVHGRNISDVSLCFCFFRIPLFLFLISHYLCRANEFRMMNCANDIRLALRCDCSCFVSMPKRNVSVLH